MPNLQLKENIFSVDRAEDVFLYVLELDIPHVVRICGFTRTIATARSKFEKAIECCHAIRKAKTFLYIGSFNISICRVLYMCCHNNSVCTSYDVSNREPNSNYELTYINVIVSVIKNHL